jgi:hypothetical protein
LAAVTLAHALYIGMRTVSVNNRVFSRCPPISSEVIITIPPLARTLVGSLANAHVRRADTAAFHDKLVRLIRPAVLQDDFFRSLATVLALNTKIVVSERLQWL